MPEWAEFTVEEPLIIFACYKNIAKGWCPYEAVRYAWSLNLRKAQGRLVLASDRGRIIGAYRPDAQGWIPATKENFPNRDPIPGRFGFNGNAAEDVVWKKYVDKVVPEEHRLYYSFRYCDPDS